MLGQKVRTLINSKQAAGSHTVQWDGRDDASRVVSGGIYFYKLTVNDTFTSMKKMILLK